MNPADPSSCLQVFRRLDGYLDRVLTPEELAVVERHLSQCATCAREFAFEARWIEELRLRLQRLEVPPDVAGRVLSRLRDSDP